MHIDEPHGQLHSSKLGGGQGTGPRQRSLGTCHPGALAPNQPHQVVCVRPQGWPNLPLGCEPLPCQPVHRLPGPCNCLQASAPAVPPAHYHPISFISNSALHTQTPSYLTTQPLVLCPTQPLASGAILVCLYHHTILTTQSRIPQEGSVELGARLVYPEDKTRLALADSRRFGAGVTPGDLEPEARASM